jgi:hypothetical protein
MEDIQLWSVQKRVFYGLAATAVVSGLIYGGIRLSSYMASQKSKKNKNK